MFTCEVCRATCTPGARGRKPRFCSGRCRVAAHRRKSIPAELLALPRWIRHQNKRPMTVEGFWASTTNPAHRSPYEAAKASKVGDGLGFVLNGDGIVCVDLDHCVEDGVVSPVAQSIVDHFVGCFVEISPSGSGLHIWGKASLTSGRRFVWNGQPVEIYPDGRYITVTGNIYRNGLLAEMDLSLLTGEMRVA